LIRVYKTKSFARFARRALISDAALWKAAQRANEGVIDADLGGGVVKQRIPRSGEGKSGGSRAIVLFRKSTRAVYVYGFEKKDRATIGPDELEAFRELGKVILAYTAEQMAEQVSRGTLFSVEETKENGDA
jgi:hypothetical protein